MLLLQNQNNEVVMCMETSGQRTFIAIIASFVTGAVLLLILSIIIFGGFNRRISPGRMERIFVEDYELLVIVANYLANFERTSIRLSAEVDIGLRFEFSDTLGGQYIPIRDEDVANAIETLRDRGYRRITKNNNTVRFLRWSMRNRGHGIVYSMDGNPPDGSTFSFLTRLEPLSVDGWFHYEEDFNEYRRRQQITW